ncbi:putative sodium bile acid cotransporter [Gorgonomyces haynaldii]|nr:putative sodium bile acid cotransporter [Gorgonomyces haynaldii]
MAETVVLVQDTPKESFWTRAGAFAKKHWFLIGLGLVICLAAAWPIAGSKKGPLKTDYLIGYGVTCIIFLLSGLGMKTKVLSQAVLHWKLILLVQVISFGITPVISFGISKLLALASFDSNLVAGLIIACSTPTTIASNVLMTKQAKGNEAAALVNAVLGNVVGVFISPLLIFGYLGIGGNGDASQFSNVFIKLGITVLAPLIVGQIIRLIWPDIVDKLQRYINFSYLNSSMLLVIVWGVFCDSFLENVFSTIPGWQTAVIFFLDIFLFCLFSFMCYTIGRLLGFSLEDSIAITMCGATKTVALGIPLINVIFVGNPYIGVLSIPLLVYHGLQLIIGSFIVTMFLNMHAKNALP